MKAYVCCTVCGKVFEQSCLFGGIAGGEHVPTLTRGHFVVCRPEIARQEGNTIFFSPDSCRVKLETEINRLVWEEGYQGLVTFGPKPQEKAGG